MEITIIIIAIIVLVIVFVNKDHKEDSKKNISEFGGMKTKYKTLIDYLTTSPSSRIFRLTYDNVTITSPTTNFSINYVGGGNIEIHMNAILPIIGKISKKWNYPKDFPQENIIEEIENFINWVMKDFIEECSNLSEKEDVKMCYLISSNVFEKKVIDEDRISLYNDFIEDDKIDNNLKYIIKNFLIPYKISPMKFSLNIEFYDNPFPVDIYHNHKHIAPSLKEIKDNCYIAQGYPDWFYAAFPDVALWAIKGEGFVQIKNKFEKLPEKELIEGNQIKMNLLDDIINTYINNTGKSLECKKY